MIIIQDQGWFGGWFLVLLHILCKKKYMLHKNLITDFVYNWYCETKNILYVACSFDIFPLSLSLDPGMV